MNRRADTRSWNDDDDQDEDGYDDSVGYSDDTDEEEEYQEFVDREFGAGRGGSRLTALQYATVIVLLIAFVLPLVVYLLAALRR